MDVMGVVEIVVVVLVATVPFWLIVRSVQRGRRSLSEPERYGEIHYQDDGYRYEPVGPVVESTCNSCCE